MTAPLRARIGVALACGFAVAGLVVCSLPRFEATRHALRIVGIWLGPSSYYGFALLLGVASVVAAVALVRPGEAKGAKAIAIIVGVLAILAALASLALAAVMSIAMGLS